MLKHFVVIVFLLGSFLSATAQSARKINPAAKKQYDTGNALLNKGKNQEAIQWFNMALKTDPKFMECYMGLGVAYTNTGQLKTANQHLDKVLKEFPKDHEAYLLRAINYYELGDTLRAFSDINAAIASNRDFSKAYYNRAVMLYTGSSFKDALEDMNTAIRLERKNAEYHFQRAVIYEELGNLRNAMADYDTVIMINPKLYDMKAYNNRAQCKKFFKDVPGAIADYNELIKEYPGNTVVLINRAFAKLSIKDGEGACEDFKTAEAIGNKAATGFLNKYCKGLYE